MKITVSVLVWLSLSACFAQQSMVFKIKFEPEKSYYSEVQITSNSELHLVAEEDVLEQIKASGVEFPMKMKMTQDIATTTETGRINNNNTIPAYVSYNNAKTTTVINGETKTTELPFKDMKLYGYYDDNSKFTLDTIQGVDNNEALMAQMNDLFNQLQKAIDFPERSLSVGDSFDNNIPMSIPISGMNGMTINLKLTYTLKRFEQNTAFFDIKQSIDMTMTENEMSMTASGEGTGSLKYDLERNYFTYYFTDTLMNFEILTPDNMLFKSKTNMTTKQVVVIEALK